MESSGLSNMLERLDTIVMSGRERAQAKRQMRYAAAIVETFLGFSDSRKPAQTKDQRAAA